MRKLPLSSSLILLTVVLTPVVADEPVSRDAPVPAPCGPQFQSTSTWGHPSPHVNGHIRGLAYDGTYYYVADLNDPDYYSAGVVYVYDEAGFVKKIPDAPPAPGDFAHGVATDGVTIWAGNYWGETIYQYDIETGNLLRTFTVPFSSPVRMDYDSATNTLWITAYDNPHVYQVDMNGHVVSSFATAGLGVNKNVALDGRGGIWVASSEANCPAQDPEIHLLRKYSLTGDLLEEYEFFTAWWAMATNINDRAAGLYQSAPPVYDAASGDYLEHVEYYTTCIEFAKFDLLLMRLAFRSGEPPQDGYEFSGSFALSDQSDNVDLLAEVVTIRIGASQVEIPAGTFQADGSVYRSTGTFGGVAISAAFEDLGGGKFTFDIHAKGADLSDTPNPVEFSLIVGDDAWTDRTRLDGVVATGEVVSEIAAGH